MSGKHITGSVQVKKGHYYAVLNLIGPNGKPQQRWIATGLTEKGNKRKAVQRMKEIIAELEEQGVVYDSSLKFHEILELWLENSKSRVRESTYRNYKIVMNAHIIPYFKDLNIKARDLRPYHLEQYYRLKLETLSANTIQKHHANIYSALEWARKNQFVNSNVAKDAWVPSRKKKKQTGSFYTMEQIAKLKEAAAGSKIEIPLMLIISYGLRRSEALGLKWDAVDFTKKSITIRATVVTSGTETVFVEDTKSDASNRILPMSEEFCTYLKAVKAKQEENKKKYGNTYHDDGYVCAKEDGTVIKPAYLSRKFKDIIEDADLPNIRLHDLRHSAATNLLNMGFTIKDVSVWLGHADITTTLNIYSHVLDESKSEMASALWSGKRAAS